MLRGSTPSALHFSLECSRNPEVIDSIQSSRCSSVIYGLVEELITWSNFSFAKVSAGFFEFSHSVAKFSIEY